MDRLRKSGDSCGARIEVVASGVPVGWGEPVYGKLDADLAAAMMSINAVKGVEIGAGFAAVAQRGTEHSDEMTPEGFLSNHAGGILGGISTGQDVTVAIAVKPTSSIRLDRHSIDKAGRPVIVNTHGRHDPCVGIRATPIAEAMLALVLMDHALRHRAQNADVRTDTPRIAAQAPPTSRRRHQARVARRRSGSRRGLRPSCSRRCVIVASAPPRANVSATASPWRHLARILHDGAVAGRDDRVAALEHGLRVQVREVLRQARQAFRRRAIRARARRAASRAQRMLHAQRPGAAAPAIRATASTCSVAAAIALRARIRAPRVANPPREFAQPFALLRDARGGMHEAARRRRRAAARATASACCADRDSAPRQLLHAVRDRDAVGRDGRRRRGGRGRAQVRDEIADREIGFVTDAGHDRQHRVEHRLRDALPR